MKPHHLTGEQLVLHQIRCGARSYDMAVALHELANLVDDENLILQNINLFSDPDDEGLFVLQMVSSVG